MSKFRTATRIINRLLISVVLVLTPILSMAVPVHADTTLDQITSHLGITDPNKKSLLGQAFANASQPTQCAQDILELVLHAKFDAFATCNGQITEIVQIIGPSIQQQRGIGLPSLFVPFPLGSDPAFAIIQGIYTTDLGRSLLQLTAAAVNVTGCATYVAALGVTALVNPGVFAMVSGGTMSGNFFLGFLLYCGDVTSSLLTLISPITIWFNPSPVGGDGVVPSPTPPEYESDAGQYCPGPCTVPAGSGGSTGGTGGGTTTPPPSQPTCTPGQYQVALFTEPYFGAGGSCVVRGVGEYPTPESIGLPNDSISSVKVGSGASVRLCANAGNNSPCVTFSSDDDRLDYYDSMPDNATSSMKVEGNTPTTNCVPNDSQVAFFVNENYQEACIIKEVGRYDDPIALGLPNDSISSVKVGNRVRVRICANDGNNSPCDQFENNVADLGPTTVQNNTASSAEVTLRGGIALCDNDLSDNNGGECKYFGAGDTGENMQNMSSHNFDNRAESIRFDPGWEGRYHIVLYVDQNQTGALAHYDGTVNSLQPPYRNSISSIKIYKHQPPGATQTAPADDAKYPNYRHDVLLEYDGGDQRRVHAWGANGLDITSDWHTAKQMQLSSLFPGTYYWQVQARGAAGEGAWSAIRKFTINTPPVIVGGSVTVTAGTTKSVQVQAYDADTLFSALALSASGLPAFATFTDNGGGTGTLNLSPTAGQVGTYTVAVTAMDGQAGDTDTVTVEVVAPSAPPAPAGYLAEYFNNKTLTGTPVLTRDEAAINNEWGSSGPGSGVNADNFSARWTKTTNFAAGDYTFSVTGDDGVRLYIDGVLAIDKWLDQGPTTYTATKTLSAGNHALKMEYFESGGGAVAKFSYQQVAAPTPPPPPSTDYSFLKGINFNGNAVTIDGNAWQSMSTALGAGLSSSSGYTSATTSLTPSPAVDSATSGMLNTAIWKQNAPLLLNQTVTNGDYQVYLWIMENYQTNNRKINVKIEGTQVATDIGYLTKNAWVKYGPYNATVADGTLNAELINAMDSPHIMGMAIYKKNSAPTPPPATGITSGNIYKIVNAGSGKALDVIGASTANGTKIQIWTDTGVVAQKWQFNQNSDGTYTILNPNSNKVLDVGGTDNGTAIQIWENWSDPEQKWAVTQNSDSTYKLRATHTSRVMDVSGGSSADGTKVQIWDDNGSAAQKWLITAVSGTTTPPPPPPAAAKLATVTENWSNGIDANKWDNWAPTKVSVVSQQLKLNTTTGSGYYGIMLKNQYDLTGSSAMVEVVSAGNQALASYEAYPLIVGPNDNNGVEWRIEGGNIKAYKKVNGAGTMLKSVSYNATTHKFLKIREAGGTLYWDHSTDGTNWTNFHSITSIPFAVTLVGVEHMVGTWQTEPSATAMIIDNFNIVPPPPSTPTFTGSGTVTPNSPNPGAMVTLNASFTSTSSANSTVRIHLEIRNPSDQQVYSRDFDNETFTPGQTKNFTTTWTVPASAATGNYIVKGGATNQAMSTWYLWSNNLGTFTVTAPTPPPSGGTELLPTAWNLVGNNGASEKYQSIASNALAGKTTLRVTYNLHGITAIGGDASAIIFDQNGWKYVSLSNYGQNGLNGSQTVDIPLSAFGLDLNQPVGTMHTRFWHNAAFTVDITSIKVL